MDIYFLPPKSSMGKQLITSGSDENMCVSRENDHIQTCESREKNMLPACLAPSYFSYNYVNDLPALPFSMGSVPGLCADDLSL